MEQIQQYHAPIMSGSMAAGHPEIEYPGCEVTTGPLGQGISNAVGMAMASKQLAATYNRDGLNVVDNKIWCFTGDGCLQEGVGQECKSISSCRRHCNLTISFVFQLSHWPVIWLLTISF